MPIRPARMLWALLSITLIAFFVARMAPGGQPLEPVAAGAAPAYPAAPGDAWIPPLAAQYLGFLARAVRGDLGTSALSGRPVSEELLARWPATLELGGGAMLIAILAGIPAGVLAAIHRGRPADYLVSAVSLAGYSMPVFWLGLLLILAFSVTLGVAPVSGRLDIAYDVPAHTGFMTVDTLLPEATATYGIDAFRDALHHLLLPALAMAAVPLAAFARITRASMIAVLSEDYIRAARARGLPEARIVWLHALRNALLPVITVGGLFFVSTAVAGAILTETIFGWPGIGSYIVSSVQARDYPVIQGGVLMIGLLVVCVNGVVELLYRAANPRMRR
ncbi:ABC transporter permease [Noviherbaspirillum sp.]|uniref:ABC transporter permease n=1 Tax=Noviherbaspirillum sp. TaxID=1926288 RepID=UPI002D6D7AD1|nr:ABC transporter permease [Noviherbaspirillum sp.]HZW21738.1 ABC transporter permease [Noviherbaspirillum sp.]